jgi:uncharacterized protein with PQ loop repeat
MKEFDDVIFDALQFIGCIAFFIGSIFMEIYAINLLKGGSGYILLIANSIAIILGIIIIYLLTLRLKK